MGDLTLGVRAMLKRGVPIMALFFAAAAGYLGFTHSPGAMAFGLTSAGTLLAVTVWRNAGLGVPLMPMIAVQQFVVNTLPILNHHEVVYAYEAAYVTQAGTEIFIFLCAMTLAWRMGMQTLAPSKPVAYVLTGTEREGTSGLMRMGFLFAGVATGFLVLQSLGWSSMILDLLPGGSYPIVAAATATASACGFFVLSMVLGSGDMPTGAQIVFWALMVSNCLLSAAGLLLSATSIVIFAVWIGLFWATGRVPVRFIVITLFALSFFNVGKYTMRGRYWSNADNEVPVSFGLLQLPSLYAEWSRASFESFVGDSAENEMAAYNARHRATPGSEQSLFDRLNNLQNLLFVIETMAEDHIAPLEGETYAVIPPLLVPRILWPSKPRSHEGQVMLNVHFGRQDLQSTFKTYVAWGLLAEAYGNFGAFKGALLLGLVLGFLFAWAEKFTCNKPILSTEGFVAFIIFSHLANSFEMVSSVLVTAIFQAIIPVVAAAAPFVHRKTVVQALAK